MKTALLVALTFAVACREVAADKPEGTAPNLKPARDWASEHFAYHSRPNDAAVCPAVLTQLETHFDVMQAYLGFTWPAQRVIDYYKFQDSKDLRKHGTCSDFNAACFFAEVGVQAREPLALHELIHAYLAPLGRRHTLLEEGLAEALSCAQEVRTRPAAIDVETAFADASWASNSVPGYQALYASARWFVGWLLKQHGPERFMHFYSMLTPGTDFARAATAFRSVYASELAAAWQAALLSPDLDAACARVWECAQPDWFAAPINDECGSTQLRSLQLNEPRWVIQRSNNGFGMHLGSCSGSPPPPHQQWLEPGADGELGDVFALLLDQGRYFVSQSPDFDPGSIELFNRDQGLAAPDSCSDVIPLRLDFRSNLTFAFQPSALTTIASKVRRAPDAETEPLVFVSWLDADPIGVGYEMSCSRSAGGAGRSREPEDAGVNLTKTALEWCTTCDDCGMGCDTNVVLPSNELARAQRIFAIDPSVRSWVRFNRTF